MGRQVGARSDRGIVTDWSQSRQLLEDFPCSSQMLSRLVIAKRGASTWMTDARNLEGR